MIVTEHRTLTTFRTTPVPGASRPTHAVVALDVDIRWQVADDTATGTDDASRTELESRIRGTRIWLNRYVEGADITEAISVPPDPANIAAYLALVFADDPYLVDVTVRIGATSATADVRAS